MAPQTAATPGAGVYATPQAVGLSCTDEGGGGCSATYFTIDDSQPTTGSTLYSAPIEVSVSAVLRFFSVDTDGNEEEPKTAVYSIGNDPDLVAPQTVATPGAGVYATPQAVSLSCTDLGGGGCSATYFTTDGSQPTTDSTLYATPIDIRVSTMPTVYGESISLRLLQRKGQFISMEGLGMSERDRKVIRKAIHRPNGIVLVTGPTGSGGSPRSQPVRKSRNKPSASS